jgi:type IV secretion system protein VirB11
MPTRSAAAPAVPEPSSLDLFLHPLQPWLADGTLTEICINRPYEAFVEREAGWTRDHLAFASLDWCLSLAKLVANHTRQRISPSEPVLSATLPGGQRIQIVLPPATEDGKVSITIRRPAHTLWTLEQLHAKGVFEQVRTTPTDTAGTATLDDTDRDLLGLAQRQEWVHFLRLAVRARKNILLSGATGSGKTTVSKALILEVPSDERLITIEDVKELSLQNQPNHVRLFYSQGGQGLAQVTAGELLASAKRQRPDRVFVSELRTGDEVYDYLVSINSGHPGSITSVHADSAEMAFVALAQLLKRSEAGRGMSTKEGVELAQLSIDIVVQCSRLQQRRFVSEVWYAPGAKRRGLAA